MAPRARSWRSEPTTASVRSRSDGIEIGARVMRAPIFSALQVDYGFLSPLKSTLGTAFAASDTG